MNKSSMFKSSKIIGFLLFLSIFFFLPSSQHVQAVKCFRARDAVVRSNISVSSPNLNVSGTISDGLCAQGCDAKGEWAVADPIQSFSYRFDNTGSWIPRTKGYGQLWWLKRGASPAVGYCTNNLDVDYQSFIYEFDFQVSIAALSPGSHVINFEWVYEPGKSGEGGGTFIIAGPTHKACNQKNVCVSVSGAGADTCTTNAQCAAPAECNPDLSNPNVACIAKYGLYGKACCRVSKLCDKCGGGSTHKACINNACVSVSGVGANECTTNADCGVPPTHTICSNYTCVSVSGAGTNECTTDTNCIPTGNLIVKARLNGVEVDADAEYQINGSETLSGSQAPKTFNNINARPTDSYIINYVSGGPTADSVFVGYSPGQLIHISADQTFTVYLDFSDRIGRCDITVQVLKYDYNNSNPIPWTGALSYGLIGPIILNGTAVEQTFVKVPAGRYYLTSLYTAT